ncbi:tyrosine-type recombinase/integrase [Sphingobium sp. AP50]|uniref:tyrosine-type recombinase/integrase n=1 Tax=Sphingobium sp. AP50 TaxID=1884369 RepID=UPI0035273D68
MKALRRRLGTAQTQARPLRFKGAVRDPVQEPARGVSVQTLLKACGSDEMGLRDYALLSIAYDTGLRASELVAIEFTHILPASDPHSRLVAIPRHKGDQVICPPLSGPKTMIVWTTKGTTNAEQEAQAGRDYRQAA